VGQLIEREGWRGIEQLRNEHIRRLRAEGKPIRDIASRVGLPKTQVSRIGTTSPNNRSV
jgi:hypothetical protein